ncbi:MAG: alpha/beta hydrolase [Candidatus Nanopelagicales bacterium]
MRRLGVGVAALLGLVLLAVSAVGLVRAQDGGIVRSTVVDGIPVNSYSTGLNAPTVVVAHGFAGSAQIMDPLARGLMRAGFTVVTFDFDGHGQNPAPLAIGPADRNSSMDALQSALGAVVGWASQQPEVDAGRIALLGHSMGAGAVVQYAVGHPVIRATVTLSLPSAGGIPHGQPARPANLLLLYGALEDSRFEAAALAALRASVPGGVAGVAYGDPAGGAARMAREVPGVEHIGILFSDATLAASAGWLAASVGASAAPSSVAPVLLWALLALMAGGLLLVPVGRIVLGPGPDAPAWPVPGRWDLALVYLASIGASVVAWAVTPVGTVVPLAVGAYMAVWFLAAGLLGGAWWLVRWRRRAGWPGLDPRAACGAAVATALAVVALVVPGTRSWASFAVVGSRWWLLLIMVAVFTAYFAVDELLVRRASPPRRIGLVLGNRAIAVAIIMVSVPLLGAPGFLVLLLPLIVLVLVVLAGYAAVVSRFRHGYAAAVLVQSVPLALLVSTTFPLVAASG